LKGKKKEKKKKNRALQRGPRVMAGHRIEGEKKKDVCQTLDGKLGVRC